MCLDQETKHKKTGNKYCLVHEPSHFPLICCSHVRVKYVHLSCHVHLLYIVPTYKVWIPPTLELEYSGLASQHNIAFQGLPKRTVFDAVLKPKEAESILKYVILILSWWRW